MTIFICCFVFMILSGYAFVCTTASAVMENSGLEQVEKSAIGCTSRVGTIS
jgi:hypothetical protein